MKIIKMIVAIFIIGFHVVLPIVFAIKESFHKANGEKNWDIKVFFENMFYVIFPWLFIVIAIALFILFYKIFKNYAITFILTLVVSLMLVKLIDK